MSRGREIADMDSTPLTVQVVASPGAYGEESEKMFQSAATLLKGTLQDLHCTSGCYEITPIRKLRFNPKWARVSVRGESPCGKDRSFCVRIRPDDGDVVWEYTLTTPKGVSAVTLQEQLVSFARRCMAIAVLNPKPEDLVMVAGGHAKAAELKPVTPESHPQPEPPTVNDSPSIRSIDQLFQRMRSAILRRDERSARSKAINRSIDAEKKKIVESESRIASLENELLAIMQEEESDSEVKGVDSLLGTLEALTHPSINQSQNL